MSTDPTHNAEPSAKQRWEDMVNANPAWITLAIVLIIMLAS